MKVQGSTEIFDLITELDSRLHGHGSSLTPSVVRDESGIVYKRPSEPQTTEEDQPTVKKRAIPSPVKSTPKRDDSLNVRRMCHSQTDCLESLLNEQMKTNEYLVDIRDGLSNLANAVENLTSHLRSDAQQNCFVPNNFDYSPPQCP